MVNCCKKIWFASSSSPFFSILNKILVKPSLGFLKGMRGFILWFWYTDQSLEGDEFFPDLAVICIVLFEEVIVFFCTFLETSEDCAPPWLLSQDILICHQTTQKLAILVAHTKISSKRFDTKNLVRNRQFWNTEQDL